LWTKLLNRFPLLSANLREAPLRAPGSINPGQRAVYHDCNIYEQRIVFISAFLLSGCVDYNSRSTSVNPKAVDCCVIKIFYIGIWLYGRLPARSMHLNFNLLQLNFNFSIFAFVKFHNFIFSQSDFQSGIFRSYIFIFLNLILDCLIHGMNDYTEVSKNLVKYRFKNNLIENNYVGNSNMMNNPAKKCNKISYFSTHNLSIIILIQ